MQSSANAPMGLLAELEGMDELPSPPDVVPKILELLNDPEVDIRELTNLLGKDPALVTKMLRIANSATYARRREVTNISQAMLTLGFGVAATLALSFSLVTKLQSTQTAGLDMSHYWRRSLLTASIGRTLGAALRSGHREELFLCGLLQDIGQMVLEKHSSDRYAEIADPTDHAGIVAHEIDELGVDHAWIGAWLLESWGLPALICEAVRHSHGNNDDEIEESHRMFLDCARIAGQLADVMLVEQDEIVVKQVIKSAEEALGLDEPAIFEALDHVSQSIPDIESQFEMDILAPETAVNMIDRARRILADVSLRSSLEVSELNRKIDSLGSHVETLENEIHTDRLTGLRNRDYMESRLSDAIERAHRLGYAISVAFMDLDGFKAINDTHSHSAGDEVLRSTAKLLTKVVRSNDVLARFGGDEFVLMLEREQAADARVVCDRIVENFNKTTHLVGSTDIELHISVGLATLDPTAQPLPLGLIDAADEALKRAKQEGKARVVEYRDIVDR